MKNKGILLTFCLLFVVFANLSFVYSQTEYTLTIQIESNDPGVPYIQGSVRVNPPGITVRMDTQLTFEAGTQLSIAADEVLIFAMCIFGEGAKFYTFVFWGGDWPNNPDENSGTVVMDSDKTLIVYYDMDRRCPTAPPEETPVATPALTVSPTPTPTPEATNTGGQLGDVNNDNTIDIVDALMIAQHYVELPVVNFNKTNADVNCDDVIDIVDALLVARFYVGILTELPECLQDTYTLTVEVEGRDPDLPACDGIVIIDPPNEVIFATTHYTYPAGTYVEAYTLGSTFPPPGSPWQEAYLTYEDKRVNSLSFIMIRDIVIKVIFFTHLNPASTPVP